MAEDPDSHILQPVAGVLLVESGCRVQRLGPESAAFQGGQVAMKADYLVALPYTEADINVGDIVRVTESLDALLVGRKLRVVHVMVGSLVWERDLYCVDDMSQG